MCNEVNSPPSWDKIKEDIEKLSTRDIENDNYYWMIEDKFGNIVGDLSVYSCNRRNGTFMYGIGIGGNYFRKGYASEAMKIMLRFFFKELRYQKATSTVYAFNNNSIRFHEKLGFQVEGCLRNMIYTNGEYYDLIYFGMTKEEFDFMEER